MKTIFTTNKTNTEIIQVFGLSIKTIQKIITLALNLLSTQQKCERKIFNDCTWVSSTLRPSYECNALGSYATECRTRFIRSSFEFGISFDWLRHAFYRASPFRMEIL